MAATRLGDVGESISAIPFDDAYADIIVLERSVMSISSKRRVATKHSDGTLSLWVVRELGYNGNSELVYVKRLSESTKAPDWVPDSL